MCIFPHPSPPTNAWLLSVSASLLTPYILLDFSHSRHARTHSAGGNDLLANEADIGELKAVLHASAIKQHVRVPTYEHLDFVW